MSTSKTRPSLALGKSFTLLSTLLIPVCVAINIVGFQIAQLLRLPIFLDAIGTVLAGAVGGPWIGLVVGGVTNAINGIFNPVYFVFAPVSMIMGLVAGLLSWRGMFGKVWHIPVVALIMSVVSTVAAGLIRAFVFGGVTGQAGSVFVAGLMAAGNDLIVSVFSVAFVQEISDKSLTVILVWFLVRQMPARYLSKFEFGRLYATRRPTKRSAAAVAE